MYGRRWVPEESVEDMATRKERKARDAISTNPHWLAGAYARIRGAGRNTSLQVLADGLMKSGNKGEILEAEKLFLQGWDSIDNGIKFDKAKNPAPRPTGFKDREAVEAHYAKIPDSGPRKVEASLMSAKPDDWDTPKVTDNATLLTGMLLATRLPGYRWIEIQPGYLILEHEDNGNRYSVNIEQIAGTE